MISWIFYHSINKGNPRLSYILLIYWLLKGTLYSSLFKATLLSYHCIYLGFNTIVLAEEIVMCYALAYKKPERKIEPCGDAFVVLADGSVHMFCPDSIRRNNIRLTRKMPLRPQLEEWMASGVIGMKIEGSDFPEREDWAKLYEFDKPMTSNFNVVCIDTAKVYGYYRIVPSDGYFQLSEIRFFGDEIYRDTIPMSIHSPIDEAESRAFDNDLLSYYIFSPERPRIIFKNKGMRTVKSIALSPRNDDNYVWPGQEYELLYYGHGDWVSLGVKVAVDHFLEFDAPDNAVLWLRNITKGREEQIFIYKDGRQLFNIDLNNESFRQ